MNRQLLVLTFVILSASLAPAADWERFRGPNGLGTAADTDIPVHFGKDDIVWKTPLPGKGNSSPIVSKGKVFIQAASDDGQRRSLVCLNEATGKIEWTKELKGKPAKTHAKNSMASSTPTADGERVYTVFWDGGRVSLVAWNYSGKQLWTQDLGGFVSQHGPGMSPIVVGEMVIVNVDSDEHAEVRAFDRKSGKPAWQKSRKHYRASYTTPFVIERDGRSEVIVSSTAGVTAYDPKTGDTIWNWTWVWKADPAKSKGGPGGPLRQVGAPILHDGLLFAISGDGGGDRHMVAIQPGPAGDVTETALVWEKKKGTAYVPMVLGQGDYLYWISDKENKAVCAEAKTGKVVWEERLSGSDQVTACPVLVNGKIYSINESGRVSVFAANPGKFELLAENDLKESVFASPAVANGRLYVRGGTHLFCIGKK